MRRLVVGSVALCAVLLVANADYVIVEESNGLIGSGEKKRTQKLYIKGDKLKLVDEEAGVECIVRLDKRLIWEIDRNKKTYVETHFDYFEQKRKEREENRLRCIRLLNKKDPLKRRLLASQMGYKLDKDGNVVEEITARTEWVEGEFEVMGKKCRRVRIFEDERQVFELWLTKEVKLPESVMRFYRESGLLSEAVCKELDKLRGEGFPLKLSADIDVGAISVRVEAEVKSLKEKDLDDKEFELPQGYKCTEKKTAEEEGPREVTCANCGKKFTIDPKKQKPIIWVRRVGDKYVKEYFCSPKCRREYWRKLKEGRIKEKKE